MSVVEGLYYPYSENKGADRLHGYREADPRLCFRIFKTLFSHDVAQLVSVIVLQMKIESSHDAVHLTVFS